MAEYRLTAAEPYAEPGADASAYVRFRISDGESIGIAQARASRTVMAFGSMEGVDWRRVLVLAVLQEAESRLVAGLMTRERGANLTLDYGADDEEMLIRLAGESKHCEWRRSAEPRGVLCAATKSGPPEPTSIPLCGTCEMPDARLVCSALVHPETAYQGSVGVVCFDGGGVSTDPSRTIQKALCEVHVQDQEWSKCHAAGDRKCWHRLIRDGVVYPQPAATSPARLVDQIPYLRLAYAERFHVKPTAFWPAVDERTVSIILSDSASATDFQQRVAALDALITRMMPLPQLDMARQTNEQGQKIGSIAALGRVLEDHCAGSALPFVERLRALHRIRNSFPSHPQSDDLPIALRALGVQAYPPADWTLAWWQVTASVAEALAAIRTAVQTSSERDTD